MVFASVSACVYLVTRVPVCPSMPASSTASSAVTWWWGNEASLSFPSQSTPRRDECALALNHDSMGTLVGLTYPLGVLVDVLNSIRHVAQVIMKCHASISVLKN